MTSPDVKHKFCDAEDGHVIPGECFHIFAWGNPVSSDSEMTDEQRDWYWEKAIEEGSV